MTIDFGNDDLADPSIGYIDHQDYGTHMVPSEFNHDGTKEEYDEFLFESQFTRYA